MKNSLRLYLFLIAFVAAAAGEGSTPKDWAIDASFPKPPTIKQTEQDSPAGAIKSTNVYLEDGPIVYAITLVKFPIAIPEDRLDTLYDSGKRGMLANGDGTLIKEEKTAIADHEGRRYLIESAARKRRSDHRVVLIGQELYQLIYEAPIASFSADQAKAFFRSVKRRAN